MPFTLIVLTAAIIWLVVLRIRDLRRKAYVWGAISLLVAAAIILLPIPTHSVTIDLASQ